jgi:GntR family transcriptional regulator / MocR family aminotransferase
VMAKLRNDINDKELTEFLGNHNLVAHAYSKCFVNENAEQGLILGYTPVRTPIIKQKIVQMERLYKSFLRPNH